MKYSKWTAALLVMMLILMSCNVKAESQRIQSASESVMETYDNATRIFLSDCGITADGVSVGSDNTAAVYVANDIVYYEAGKDFTYGEGGEKDAHSAEEAAAHTVLHITKPGIYSLSGKLSLGQIAVDLGENAKDESDAVVTLLLNGVDITCEVAPAVIFYNVYECGNDDVEKANKDVDTASAGANVVIADGTINTVNGSYVEKIYKPESVVLNEDKTEVEDADKLHKYDAAFYSRQSMNIFGGEENTGILNIRAENEGLDSELHLTINGGGIHIESGNDGINTNKDGVSVTTINGGVLTITVTGETGEGDGIDSNGWLVINGGTVIAEACSDSADAGIDSDMGIHINGGTVIATGHMLDRIEEGGQSYAVLKFAQKQSGGKSITMKDKDNGVICEVKPENVYSVLVFSSDALNPGTYTLWSDSKQLAGSAGSMMRFSGTGDGDINNFERHKDMLPPAEEHRGPEEIISPENSNHLKGFTLPHDHLPPEDFATRVTGKHPQIPDGGRPGYPGEGNVGTQERTSDFVICDGGNMFNGISYFFGDSSEN